MKLFFARLFGVGSVTINGQKYSGRNVELRVFVDGQEAGVISNTPRIEIRVEGNVETLQSASGDVTVHGSAASIRTASGDITCQDVKGSVSTASGDVRCGAVQGDVSTVTGDVRS